MSIFLISRGNKRVQKRYPELRLIAHPSLLKRTNALYVCYAPAGVSAETVELQLRGIEENIKLFPPNCEVEQLQVLKA